MYYDARIHEHQNCCSVNVGLDFMTYNTNLTQNGVLPESYPIYGNSVLFVATLGVVLRTPKYDPVSGQTTQSLFHVETNSPRYHDAEFVTRASV